MSAHPYYPSGNPRFNHIAMSVPADLLAEDSRRDIVGFWHDVLGFDEMPTMTIDGSFCSCARAVTTSMFDCVPA